MAIEIVVKPNGGYPYVINHAWIAQHVLNAETPNNPVAQPVLK
jgi:hypothetical protein